MRFERSVFRVQRSVFERVEEFERVESLVGIGCFSVSDLVFMLLHGNDTFHNLEFRFLFCNPISVPDNIN